MALRLLQKSDIAKAKSLERQRDIEEGAKIAKRIDNLREVAAKEEASLEKFRRETVAQIHKETKAVEQERDTLRTEVAQLKKERAELMQPLDNEWAEVKAAWKNVRELYDKTEARIVVAQDEEKQIRKAVKLNSDSLARSLTLEGKLKDKLAETAQSNKVARQALANAKKIERDTLARKDKVLKELAQRDMECAARERGIDLQQANLDKREQKLATEWARLQDRKEMVERQIKRIKK